jgi:hypothetical protein
VSRCVVQLPAPRRADGSPIDLVRAESKPFRQTVSSSSLAAKSRKTGFVGAKPVTILTEKSASGYEGDALIAVE